MPKILCVLDGLNNVRDLGDGRYESGFWHNPDLGCEIIRVFAKDSLRSHLGGKILYEFKDEKGNKIIGFKDDVAQHGKDRPDRFKPNGCYASIE